MNILHLTSWDCYGIQFNGYLLSKTINKLGHTSRMLVAKQQFEDENIGSLGLPLHKFLDKFLIRLEQRLSLQRVLTLSFSTLFSHPWYKEADVIHIQLAHAVPFLNLLTIPRISREKPVVWTVHDPWLLTGHCIHPLGCDRWKIGCGQCPDLKIEFPIRNDRTAINWKIKKYIFDRSHVNLVVASNWLKDLVNRHPFLNRFPTHLIPFGIDTMVFKPIDKITARRQMGIPNNVYVVTCRWSPDNPFKGNSFIEEALLALSLDKPLWIITFDGDSSGSPLRKKYHMIDHGWEIDQNKVIRGIGAADIFLAPSIAESFGLMAVEAMACGTPVIVFEGTSLPSVVHAPYGGVSIPQSASSLAHTIQELIQSPNKRDILIENGLNIVRREYQMESYVSKHLDLYREVIEQRKRIID